MASLLILKELLKYHDCHWNYTLPSPPPPLLVTGSLWGILKWQLVDRSQRYFFHVKLLNATHLHVDYLQLSRGRRHFIWKRKAHCGGRHLLPNFLYPFAEGGEEKAAVVRLGLKGTELLARSSLYLSACVQGCWCLWDSQMVFRLIAAFRQRS